MKTVTYNDLEGAAPDIEAHGVAFHDGDAVEVEDGVAEALKGNRFFSVDGEKDNDERVTHVNRPNPDYVPVDNFDGMGIAELRAEAEERHINHDGKSKAQLREAIRAYDATL